MKRFIGPVCLILAALFLFGCARGEIKQKAESLDIEETAVPALDASAADEAEQPVQELAPAPESSSIASAGNTHITELSAFTGRFSGVRGVNIAEINPANYQRINREAMEGMGMAPHYVAYLSGEKLYLEGNYDRAIAEFGRAISLKADYTGAYVYRGNARRRMGDLGRALDDYNRALALEGGYAEVYNYRGFVHAQRGDLRRAIADYTQAIRYRADYADAYFNRAHAHSKMGNWDLCIADYTQVIRLEPANAIAYNERGNAWHSKGDRSRAAADYEAADRLARRE